MSPPRWRQLARAEARIAGGCATVAGVDEVGRGPLAGPVIAAAVVLDPTLEWDGLDDSKQLAAEVREQLSARVRQGARAFAWAVVGPRAIDATDIRRASLLAMQRAVHRLRIRPELALIDGDAEVPGLRVPQRTVVRGDSTALSIAAASIVAKVIRDRLMVRFAEEFPQYGFARHKGYGTPEHLAALRAHGPCRLHRYSFAPVQAQELPLG